MNIYIPIVGIQQVLAVYAVIGVLLYLPLVVWQNRFISGNRGTFDGMRKRHVVKGILASAVVWPILLGYNIKTELRYRRKGLL